jgi:hypothetical protein
VRPGKPELQPLELGWERLMLVAVMAAPPFELVPRTAAHSSAVIADRPTLFVPISWVVDESRTLVLLLAPRTVTVFALSAVTVPAAKPKFANPAAVDEPEPPARGERPAGELPPPWPKPEKPVEHAPLTGADIVTRSASTAPVEVF